MKVADFGLTRIVSSPTAAPMTGQCGTFQVRCGHVGGRLFGILHPLSVSICDWFGLAVLHCVRADDACQGGL